MQYYQAVSLRGIIKGVSFALQNPQMFLCCYCNVLHISLCGWFLTKLVISTDFSYHYRSHLCCFPGSQSLWSNILWTSLGCRGRWEISILPLENLFWNQLCGVASSWIRDYWVRWIHSLIIVWQLHMSRVGIYKADKTLPYSQADLLHQKYI